MVAAAAGQLPTLGDALLYLRGRAVALPIEDFRVTENGVTVTMAELMASAAEPAAMAEGGERPHVVVVGGGLAGLSAAMEAAASGARVTLVEKTDRVGGNSAKATSGINAWGSTVQREQNVSDADALFAQDTMVSGRGGTAKNALVARLTARSASAISWLQSHGVPLSVLSQLGGHSRKRAHRAPDKADGTPTPIGFTIMRQLEQHVRTSLSDRVTIVVSATVKRLTVSDDGRVTGIAYTIGDGEEVVLEASAVVLATGGFSNDHTPTSLLAEFAKDLQTTPTTNGPFATGDGVKMARAIGVSLIDMDKVQLHPTGFVSPKDPAARTKFLGPEALRGSGGVLLNGRGERFVDELGLRSVVSAAIRKQGDEYPGGDGIRVAYCVLNDEAADLFGRGAFNFYWKKLGLFREAATVEDVAAIVGASAETVRATLTAYGAVSASKERCPLTGKHVYPSVLGTTGPFYVAVITPSIHYTMGGCEMTPFAELVSKATGAAVPGLYGAGEVTGGVHGGNRLGGNSLLECVVFGRTAGSRAVAATRAATATAADATVASIDGDDLYLAFPAPLQEGKTAGGSPLRAVVSGTLGNVAVRVKGHVEESGSVSRGVARFAVDRTSLTPLSEAWLRSRLIDDRVAFAFE